MTTNEQRRADAFADAETLRNMVRDTFPSTRWFEFFGEDGLDARVGVLLSGISGYGTEGQLLPPSGVCRWAASLAARAAFHVVPGLRGGE